MPIANPPKPFSVCPEGEDILFYLINVEEVQNAPDARFNPNGWQWRWNFRTVELTDEEDEPFKMAYFTGTEYIAGSDRAKLTKLLDKICRDLTKEEKETIDTDTLIGKKYRADVVHATRPDGSMSAKMENIRRLQPKAAPAATGKPAAKKKPVEDDDEDGFADVYADE